MSYNLVLHTGNAHRRLARDVAKALGKRLGRSIAGTFPDNEAEIQIEDNVREDDLYIIQPLGQRNSSGRLNFDRNEKELELLIAAARSSAKRITAVVPYLGYARQDRKDRPRVPISVVSIVRNLVQTGVDRVLVLDLHTAGIVGLFEAVNPSIRVDHLYVRPCLLEWMSQQDLRRVTIASVDVGGAKMVESYFERLEEMGFPVTMGIAHKSRIRGKKIKRIVLLGRFRNRHVYFVDDMITTGSSILAAANAALAKGAACVSVVAAHAVFANTAACQELAKSRIRQIIVSDTLPISRQTRATFGRKLVVVSVAKLLAKAIWSLHTGGRLSPLFEMDGLSSCTIPLPQSKA